MPMRVVQIGTHHSVRHAQKLTVSCTGGYEICVMGCHGVRDKVTNNLQAAVHVASHDYNYFLDAITSCFMCDKLTYYCTSSPSAS